MSPESSHQVDLLGYGHAGVVVAVIRRDEDLAGGHDRRGGRQPFLLPLSLLRLLTRRAARDDKKCRAEYGALWEEYCRKARYRMFPLIY